MSAFAARGLSIALAVLGIAWTFCGCGYTVVKQSPPPGAQLIGVDTLHVPEEPLSELPPGHPPISDPADWVGLSFLDMIVGTDEPLRFESLRTDRNILFPTEHAHLTLRITLGDPIDAMIWQIRIDEFGWFTAATWQHTGLSLDMEENMASTRVEFRLDRMSEAALRAMLIALMPITRESVRRIPEIAIEDIPWEFWPHEHPGLIELEYRIERLDALTVQDWPGGKITAPLDLTQLMIGTWDGPPPFPTMELIWRLAEENPLIIDIAMVTEAVILAWEIEGRDQEMIQFPLRVGR